MGTTNKCKLTAEEEQAKRVLQLLYKQAKEAKKLNQLKLSKLVGYDQSQVSRHLKGMAPLTQKAIIAYALAFGVPPSMFNTKLAYLNPSEELKLSDGLEALHEKTKVFHDPLDILAYIKTGEAPANTDEVHLLPHLQGRRVYAIRGGDLSIPNTQPDDYIFIDPSFRPKNSSSYGIWIVNEELLAGTAKMVGGTLYLTPPPPHDNHPILIGDWDDKTHGTFVGKITSVLRVGM